MAVNHPLIQWSWPYQDFGNQEFEMQWPKSLVTPFPKLWYASSCTRSNDPQWFGFNSPDLFEVSWTKSSRCSDSKSLVTPIPEFWYGNSCMRSTTLVDLGLMVTIPPELKGCWKTLSLNRVSGFRIPGFHDLQRWGVLPFGFLDAETLKLIQTKPSHPQSASGLRVPGFCDLRRRGVLPSGFLDAKTPKVIHTKPAHPQSASGFCIPGFHDLRRRGVLPSGFPDAETPKVIYTKPMVQITHGSTTMITLRFHESWICAVLPLWPLQVASQWNSTELPHVPCRWMVPNTSGLSELWRVLSPLHAPG